MNRNRPKPAHGRKEPTTIAAPDSTSLTIQQSPEIVSQAAVGSDVQSPDQEAAAEDDFLLHLSGQTYNEMGQPTGEDMQAPVLKTEDKELYPPPSTDQNEFLYKMSACHDPTVLELQGTRPSHQLDYVDLGPAQLNLPSSSGRKASTNTFGSYFDANNARCGDSAELYRNHGFPHDSAWSRLKGGSAHTHYADPTNSSTHGLPFPTGDSSGLQNPSFFNEEYVFEGSSMSNPYRASIDHQFPNPLDTGGHGHSWSSQYARPRKR